MEDNNFCSEDFGCPSPYLFRLVVEQASTYNLEYELSFDR